MAFETYPKGGQHGSKKMFDTESYDGLTTRDNTEKREYMKSGRNAVATKAEGSYKFKSATASPGNTSRREYMKSGNKGQAGFGTKVS